MKRHLPRKPSDIFMTALGRYGLAMMLGLILTIASHFRHL